jgi:hypothetical protein
VAIPLKTGKAVNLGFHDMVLSVGVVGDDGHHAASRPSPGHRRNSQLSRLQPGHPREDTRHGADCESIEDHSVLDPPART